MTQKTPREHLAELKGIPILPTVITLGNLGAGFVCIALCTNSVAENHELLLVAAWMIFLGMFFDTFDGKVARMTNQTSEFGEQMDSLADLICFGVAPAILAKSYLVAQGNPNTKLSWIIPLFYVFCAALRLARYNVESASPTATKTFKGLPSPAAAGALASLVLVQLEYNLLILDWLMGSVILLMGALMVSPFGYSHFSNKILGGRKSFAFLVALISLVIVFFKFKAISLALVFNAYALIGLVNGIRKIRAADITNPFDELNDDE